MRSIPNRRSLDEIVGDVVVELQPLKPGAGDPRAEIGTHIELVKKEDAALAKGAATYAAWKDVAARMLLELDSLGEKTWPGIENVRWILEWPLKVILPSSHVDWRQRMCAFHTDVLIKQFSEKPRVFSRGKNVHRVALLLYEAVTGEPLGDDPAKLLRAVRAVRHR
jgi:hypothetical protein